MPSEFFCHSCRRHKPLACLGEYVAAYPSRQARCKSCKAQRDLMSNPANIYKTFRNGHTITVAQYLASKQKRRERDYKKGVLNYRLDHGQIS